MKLLEKCQGYNRSCLLSGQWKHPPLQVHETTSAAVDPVCWSRVAPAEVDCMLAESGLA